MPSTEVDKTKSGACSKLVVFFPIINLICKCYIFEEKDYFGTKSMIFNSKNEYYAYLVNNNLEASEYRSFSLTTRIIYA
jgi:hypothetical protein